MGHNELRVINFGGAIKLMALHSTVYIPFRYGDADGERLPLEI